MIYYNEDFYTNPIWRKQGTPENYIYNYIHNKNYGKFAPAEKEIVVELICATDKKYKLNLNEWTNEELEWLADSCVKKYKQLASRPITTNINAIAKMCGVENIEPEKKNNWY